LGIAWGPNGKTGMLCFDDGSSGTGTAGGQQAPGRPKSAAFWWELDAREMGN
jgi:hypothetical protein